MMGVVAFHVLPQIRWRRPEPPLGSLPALLDEVDEDPTDNEHVGVGVVHESGWAIGVFRGWVVTLEHVEDLDTEPRHMVAGSNRQLVLKLMRAAAEGDLAVLETQPWHVGYRPT
jgi:hypothetical protein